MKNDNPIISNNDQKHVEMGDFYNPILETVSLHISMIQFICAVIWLVVSERMNIDATIRNIS